MSWANDIWRCAEGSASRFARRMGNGIVGRRAMGFQKKPGPQWRRLAWSDLGQRDGFEFWAVDGHWPDLRYTAQSDWADPSTMPVSAGPRISPTTDSSWPASILPPPQGSLDEESLLALIAVLAKHTAPVALRHCGAY
jgi:hypothetical protein